MELMTRCPGCGTVFSASVEQMKRRKGYIRCVQCATIFDGFDAVVDDNDSGSISSPAVVSAGVASSAAASSNEPSVRVPEPPELHAGQDPYFVLPEADSQSSPSGTTTHPADAPAVFVEPRRYRAGTRAGVSALSARQRGTDGGPGALRWLAVLLVLVVVASLLMYAFRAQIATEAPQLRPLLEKACDSLDCTVEYPQRIDRISIMSSSLQVVQGGAALMELNVVMRNTWDKPQQWPALVLELSDLSGAVVARRVFQPADYLDASQLSGPFGAAQEIRVLQRVSTEGLQVNGFQIKKFFPPKD